MTGLCEFISIVMTVTGSGSPSLTSTCVPTYADCDKRWNEAVKEPDSGLVIAQCLSIDDLAAMRDSGRRARR